MHPKPPGGFLLLEPKVKAALQKVMSDVLELFGIAWNGLRGSELPPVVGQHNSVSARTPDIRDVSARVVNQRSLNIDRACLDHWPIVSICM
jgi:hypothetical protein